MTLFELGISYQPDRFALDGPKIGKTALMAAMAIRIYERYGTFDTNRIRKLRG